MNEEAIKKQLDFLFDGCEGYKEFRAILPGTAPRVKFVKTFEEALSFIRAEALTKNVYVGMTTRKDSTSGAKANCYELTALYIEIDASSFSSYQDMVDYVEKLKEDPMYSPSMIIHSGNGFHIYWKLKEPLAIDNSNIKFIEATLRGLAIRCHGSPESCEVARVLRVAGTKNHKSAPAKDVKLVHLDEARRFELSDFDLDMKEGLQATLRPAEPIIKTIDNSEQLKRFKECSFVSHAIECGKDLSEPLWGDFITNAIPLPNAHQFIHEASASYCKDSTRKYSHDETEAKIEHFIRDGHKPHTCAQIAKDGYNCPNLSTCIANSPLEFSRIKMLPDPIDAEELMDMNIPSIEYHVKYIIPKGGKVIISGTSEAGKSLMAMNLAVAMTSGMTKFLIFDIAQTNVGIFDFEVGISPFRARLIPMIRGKNLKTKNLHISLLPSIDFTDSKIRIQIESRIVKRNIKVVIFDPMGCIWQGNENESVKIRELTSYFNELIAKYGITIIIVHHWRKSSDKFKEGAEMAAGSYFLNAWAESHITLKRNDESYVTISHVKNRHGDKFKPFMAKLDENLWFEFINSIEKKYEYPILIDIFSTLGKDHVSLQEIADYAKKHHGGPSRSTIDSLVSELIAKNHEFSVVEGKIFNSNDKKLYLVKSISAETTEGSGTSETTAIKEVPVDRHSLF